MKGWIDKYENGGEMKYYQQGLDFKPKSISANGSEVPIKDDSGYWNPNNWGKAVQINSSNITMKGVNQPLIGISDAGDIQLMQPNKDYKFKGNNVTEYPILQNGGWVPDFKNVADRDNTFINPVDPIDRNIVSAELSTKDLREYFPLDKRKGFLDKLAKLATYDDDLYAKSKAMLDDSKVITFGEDVSKLGYLRNATITENAKKDILKYAKKQNIDPNLLLSAIAIENPEVRANRYANTHDIGVKMLEQVGLPTYKRGNLRSNTLTNLAKNAGAYMKDGSINYKKLDKKIEEWIPYVNKIDSTLNSIESPIDAHAIFLSNFGLDSVNPAQQKLKGVKESYSQMVKKGADYIKSRKIFNNGGEIDKAQNGWEEEGVKLPPELQKIADMSAVNKQQIYQTIYQTPEAKQANQQLRNTENIANIIDDFGTGTLTWGTMLAPPTEEELERGRGNWLDKSSLIADKASVTLAAEIAPSIITGAIKLPSNISKNISKLKNSSNILEEPPLEVILDDNPINLHRGIKNKKSLPSFNKKDLGNDLILYKNPSRVENEASIMGTNRSIKTVKNEKTGEYIDLKTWKGKDNEIYYYFSANMPSSKIKAGKAYKELETYIPRGATILENRSLSYDSFLNAIKQTKNPKFKIDVKGDVPLNNMSVVNKLKNSNKISVFSGSHETSFDNLIDAKEALKEINDQLNKYNLPNAKIRQNKFSWQPQAHLPYEDRILYGIDLPNISFQKLYKNGGQLQDLENLTNFTNYNKPSDWLSKYD